MTISFATSAKMHRHAFMMKSSYYGALRNQYLLLSQQVCLGRRGFWKRRSGSDDSSEDSGDKKDAPANDEPSTGKPGVEVIADADTRPSRDSVQPVGTGDHAPHFPHVLALPLVRRPMFPGIVLPLTVSNKVLLKSLIASKESGNPYVGLFLRKNSDAEIEQDPERELISSLDQIHSVGTFAQIHNIVTFEDAAQVVMLAHRRIKINSIHDEGPPLTVTVDHLQNPKADRSTEDVRAYCNEIVATLRDVVRMNPLFKENMQFFSQRIDIHDPYKLADFAASVTTANAEVLQEVLEEMDVRKRLSKSLELIIKERELSKLQLDIKEQVEGKINENQRKYFLMEQLKSIKKELGMEKDDKEALVSKFKERVKDLGAPKQIVDVVTDELEKLESLEKNSSEFNVTRNYLDWLTQLPWSKFSEENFDVDKARIILDEDHYGLSDIKERILEFVAVSQLKGRVGGKILCFVGPPGVGKTSIGKSIARALNREFFRFSVGGLTDVAEIKGHRRTYVGAMPGKLMQCLKSVQTSNPLVLIDEIDKLGRGYQGDPASALLEVLDPQQNGAFMDHYLDVPVDLSKVLFICTANIADTIPGPLLDRMEVLRLSGYDLPEKVKIAQEYLEPRIRRNCGLQADAERTPDKVGIGISAVEALIRNYCREAGVRNLEQHIEKIYRKLALKIVQDGEQAKCKDWIVSDENLGEYVGKPRFLSDRLYEKPISGVVMGLAWTAMGGSALYIETTVIKKDDSKGGSLLATGQLGSVMEESTKIAHTVARAKLLEYAPGNTFFDRNDVHMHVPEGATPKDGPSAGITMTTALISLATQRPVAADVAMTGEISLTGKVLPVGGIKEKTIAARRAGIKRLILPKDNRRDFEDLPEYLRDGLEVFYADQYDDVYEHAFDISSN